MVGEWSQAKTPLVSIPSAVDPLPKSLAKLEGVRGAVVQDLASEVDRLGVLGVKNIPQVDSKSAFPISGNGLLEGRG
jgi:hypothetical protein